MGEEADQRPRRVGQAEALAVAQRRASEQVQPVSELGLVLSGAHQQRAVDLDRVSRWLRAAVYVNCVPGLAGPSLTMIGDGFSQLIRSVWGDAGGHARVAPGVHALPFNVPTVVEAMVEID
ncbi:MAG: hypothetical protein GEU86_17710 [Actinophytocola sp.]|nr:hypothetical protein [Actinophytocola sp.]